MHSAIAKRVPKFESGTLFAIPAVPAEVDTHRLFQLAGLALVAAASYYVGTRLGFELTPPGSPISTVWPPNAILLAILLLAPKRDWYVAIFAVLPVHLALQSGIGVPMTTSIGWFIGNTGEALLGALLVRRYTDPRTMFENLRGTVVFLIFAVVVAPFTTSFVDSAAVVATGWGKHFWAIWTERQLSNSLSELVIVPSIVTAWLKASRWKEEATLARCLEAAALGIGLVIVSFVVFNFGPTSTRIYSGLIYLPLSLLLLAAFRFGVSGSCISLLTLAIISINGALRGRGPFVTESMHANVLSIQIFLSSVAAPLILLTAVITERRKMELSLHEVAKRLIGAQQEERERLGRELHDDVGQQLAIVESDLHELKDRLNCSYDLELTGLLEKIANASQSARELSHELHPSTIAHVGLEASLRQLCHALSARKSVNIDFRYEGSDSEMSSEIALCLYRIAQEAFQNVLRHSHASKISVMLFRDTHSIVLRINDDGVGFEPSILKQHGLGLVGMRERLRTLNGELTLSTATGKGTTLDAFIPL